jgi:uncharacterized protein (DUF302 family)
MDRFKAEVEKRGMTVFAHIDHAAGAETAGLTLRPTDLLIFGNATGGPPLMAAVQTIAIDLPLKAIVWQDDADDTWLSYNEPDWLAERHALGSAAEMQVKAMTQALHMMAASATTSS